MLDNLKCLDSIRESITYVNVSIVAVSHKAMLVVLVHHAFIFELVDFEEDVLYVNSPFLGSSGWPPPDMIFHCRSIVLSNVIAQYIIVDSGYAAFELSATFGLADIETCNQKTSQLLYSSYAAVFCTI